MGYAPVYLWIRAGSARLYRKYSQIYSTGDEIMNHTEEENVGLDITIIVDRSGSMEHIREDAIGSFNVSVSAPVR